MKPVTATVTVPQPREEVFDFLDVLEDAPGGGTRITFELAWLEAPISERLMAPITRSVVGRANDRALRRLAEALANRMEEAR